MAIPKKQPLSTASFDGMNGVVLRHAMNSGCGYIESCRVDDLIDHGIACTFTDAPSDGEALVDRPALARYLRRYRRRIVLTTEAIAQVLRAPGAPPSSLTGVARATLASDAMRQVLARHGRPGEDETAFEPKLLWESLRQDAFEEATGDDLEALPSDWKDFLGDRCVATPPMHQITGTSRG